MADEKITELTELTTPVSTDPLPVVEDPTGTPATRKLTVGRLLGNDGAWVNLVKNSPEQIVGDGLEPQWWDDVANAAITDEDAVGEGIPDKTRRVFKVVTTANDVYGYQTYTLADESLLDAGVTVVSASCWVYCATGAKASIGLYGTNLGLQESAQAGAGAWTLLTVENITLHAGDASFQLRLIVDTDTAWFAMPMLNVGSKALPWRPRGTRFVNSYSTSLNLTGQGDVAATVLDLTANTHPLAVTAILRMFGSETAVSGTYVRIQASAALSVSPTWDMWLQVSGTWTSETMERQLDDEQTIRYGIAEGDADNDVSFRIYTCGFRRWE